MYNNIQDDRVCTKNFYEEIVPAMSDELFRSHFRLTRDIIQFLLMKITPLLSKEIGRPSIPLEKALLAVVWVLATQDTYRSIADRFDMSKSTLSDYFFQNYTNT